MALRGCAERYCPHGYTATLSFLVEVAGDYHRDEAALLRAVDHISASRELWLASARTFADRRRAEKRVGRRSLKANEPNGAYVDRYHGSAAAAAKHALKVWPRRLPAPAAMLSPDAEELRKMVDAVLRSEGLDAAWRARLADRLSALRRKVRSDLWETDREGHFAAWRLYGVAHLVDLALSEDE